jgi:hypothetical protein
VTAGALGTSGGLCPWTMLHRRSPPSSCAALTQNGCPCQIRRCSRIEPLRHGPACPQRSNRNGRRENPYSSAHILANTPVENALTSTRRSNELLPAKFFCFN